MTSCFGGSQEKLFYFALAHWQTNWNHAILCRSCCNCECAEAAESFHEVEMKLLALVCFFFAVSYLAYSAAAPQIFPTSAGDVKVTPLEHTSPLVEAGGKGRYLDPASP